MFLRENYKKAVSIFLLTIILLAFFIRGAYAWDFEDLSSTTWPYLVGSTGSAMSPYGKVLSVKDNEGNLYSTSVLNNDVRDIIPLLIMPKGQDMVFSIDSFYLDYEGNRESTSRFIPMQDMPADFSSPVKFFVQAEDGRGYPMFIMSCEDRGVGYYNPEDVGAILDYSVRPLLSNLIQYNDIMDVLYNERQDGVIKSGDHHPVHTNLLWYVGGRLLANNFGSNDGNVHFLMDFDCYASDAEMQLRSLMDEYSNAIKNPLDYYKATLETIAPFYLDYVENNRIAYPIIDSFAIGASKGIIDREKNIVRIRLPEGIDRGSLPLPEIGTTGWIKTKQVAGSISGSTLVYSLIPYEESTGIVYDGLRDEYGLNLGADLSALWKVKIEVGDPYTLVTSFAIKTNDGITRQAVIDEENKTIVLNLPDGTDLSSLTPIIDHTGTHTNMDSGSIDFTSSQILKVYNSEYNLESDYQVIITAYKSSEKKILSYSIDEANGIIDGTNIDITIPYATDLSAAMVNIEISEFATIAESPAQLSEGENLYIIKAEDETTVEYIVTITRAPAATGCSIESFKYGSVEGVIDESGGTIDMVFPAGTSLTFAPEIKVSQFAVVEPASGVVQDFSKPIQYTVTAENGDQNVYTVSATVSDVPVDNEYRVLLQNVVDKIISRYHYSASDDWEWLDLGLYQKALENYSDGFGIADNLSKLDCSTNVAMTNIARKLMTLTARGFNCSNLSQYNEGEPYKDSKGNEIKDLAAVMYNYSGGYTINGPTFALLGLDMGNYTVPDDAVWTREKLIETLLAHVYLSDNFGTDMVAAIMYALAPYTNDAVYGDRVQAKLDEGLSIIIQKMNANEYYFGAWGSANSETASWVIMALTAMGIDPYTDPRFSDGNGKNVIQNWVDNYVNESGGYFHHTTSVMNNAIATYEGCYAAMWYLGFLDNGGAGHPYSLYYHRFDFSAPLSSDASILSFELEGKQGVIEEDGENRITVTLSSGTPLTNMKPEIELAEGAKLKAPSLPVTFVEGVPQPFTVCAEDGKTYKTYFVTVVYDDVLASGAELDVDSLVLQNSVLNDESILSKSVTTASDGATEILLTVKPGVNTAKMYLSADVSYAAVCDPLLDGSRQLDLSDWLTVTVTSEDGTNINVYRIKVVAKGQAEITFFEVEAGGVWYSGAIDNASNTITVRDVDDSTLTSTVLETKIVFTGLTCSPTSGVATDFASSVTYTLGGSTELASRTYTVSVLNKSGQHITANSSSGDPSGGTEDPSGPSGGSTASGARILGLTVLGKEAVIDENAGTIVVTLPKGTDVSAVALDISLSEGASSDPSSGQIVGLSAPLTITVRNGVEVRQYVISVVLERSISEKLWDEMLEESDVVDHQISHGRGIH